MTTFEHIEDSIKACYSTWSQSYYDDYYGEGAAYPPVHRDLLKDLLKQAAPETILDAGCGSASFLRDIADWDAKLYGFDLTPEMVEEGKRIFAGLGRDPEAIWQGSVLDAKDFAPPQPTAPKQFDAAVCSGVMPHIPAEADVTVLKNLRASVKPGGTVIVEARNQLFSLFTLNRYSHEFLLSELVRGDDLKAKAGDKAGEVQNCLNDLGRQFRMDLPPIRKGKEDEPGYDEVLSRLHNPLVLQQQMYQSGYTDVRLHFYHYHCLPPMCEARVPEFFRAQSLAMENPDDWRGMFMASAFMVSGKRA